MPLSFLMLIATAKCWNLPQVMKIMVNLSCINLSINDKEILSLVESEDAMEWWKETNDWNVHDSVVNGKYLQQTSG